MRFARRSVAAWERQRPRPVHREFAIRPGSGGKGLHNGGDGVVRDVECRAPLNFSVSTERRSIQPYGMKRSRSQMDSISKGIGQRNGICNGLINIRMIRLIEDSFRLLVWISVLVSRFSARNRNSFPSSWSGRRGLLGCTYPSRRIRSRHSKSDRESHTAFKDKDLFNRARKMMQSFTSVLFLPVAG